MNRELEAVNGMIRTNPDIYNLLSQYGKQIYFIQSGILAQSWEAREKAKQYNATLGEAQRQGVPMYSTALHQSAGDFEPEELYPYAPPGGLPELRELWREKMIRENPFLAGKNISLPVVTAGLTHGLSLVAELFLDPGDAVVVHDMHWENYTTIFETRHQGTVRRYPFFEGERFNVEGMERAVMAVPGDKALVVLNFPNNPTGYSPTREEATAIAKALSRCAAAGKRLAVLCDDAYYGFRYGEGLLEESLFGLIAGSNPGILAIRVDGATKEAFAGGLRVGFLTFAGAKQQVLDGLENKTAGAVRCAISSGARPSQALLLRGLKNGDFQREMEAHKAVLRSRGRLVMELCAAGSASGKWRAYPFNSGYFVCLRLEETDAYAFRRFLLEEYSVGIIALNSTDIRISFPCLEEKQIRELFALLDGALKEYNNKRDQG